MSKKVTKHVAKQLGDKVLEVIEFRGDDTLRVAMKHWKEVATFLRDDDKTKMDMFTDLTAVDYPEREPDGGRFDLILMVRSSELGHRVIVSCEVDEGATPDTLVEVWAGANWAEREIYDMFGIKFKDHPDMRRILLYEEFEGYPLRKDYPIDRAQPLVEYRDAPDIHKLPPFGIEQGQPFARVDWEARLSASEDPDARPGGLQVSPAIAAQQGQIRTLSDSAAAQMLEERLRAKRASAAGAESTNEEQA